MDIMSEEDRPIKTIYVNQEDCTLQLPSDANKNNIEDKSLMETELQNNTPHQANKDLCLHSNKNEFGITKLDTVRICFICKTVIQFCELDPCNKIHLRSSKHKLNQFELFNQCFYNPGLSFTNNIQNYISNNSSIDFSSATEISTGNVNVNCFVCKIEIPSLRSSEDILIADFLHHLKDENHIRNIQDNFSWTCDLPSKGHMTLYKTLFYCSLCEESVSCDDCDLIPTAVSHLETKHCEGFISLGFEVETIRFAKKTSIASDGSFDNMKEISDDLYTTCEDESSFVDDDTYVTPDAYDVSLPKVKDEETENNKHEDLSDVCIESGENMEMIGDDLEVKVQLYSVSHERENGAALVLPALKRNVEHSLPSVEKNCETLDNHDSAKISVCKQFAVDKHPKQVLIEELSVCNGDIIPKGNKNQGHTETSIEQKCETKKKSSTDERFFSNLYDCLPASFHKDLSFVTIKSNQFHCELCICSIGVVLNVFDSSFILHSHFSLTYHKNQMEIFSKPISENKKPKVLQNLSNDKRKEKTIILNLAEEKLTDANKINQRNHVPLVGTRTGNSQTNMESNTISSEDKNISNLKDISSKSSIVKKQTDLDIISSTAISKDQKQNEIHDMFRNIQTSPKQTKVKVVPSSPPRLTQTSTDKRIFDIQDLSRIAVSKVQKQNEIHYTVSNIQTFPKQTEVNVVPSSHLTPTKVNNEIDITKPKTLLPPPIIDLFSDSNLRVHHEFFKHTSDGIYCCLCTSDVCRNQVDLKNHITGITHKVQFLSQLKKSLKERKRNQVKFLMFMNGMLYCSLCKCFVSPWDSFVGICEGAKAHFEMDAHTTYDEENKNKSGEARQDIMSLNEKRAMTEAEICSDSPIIMTNETEGAKNENKQKIRNVLLYSLSQKSHDATVENAPKESKLVVDISNHSDSGLLNDGTLPNDLDMKQKPEKELSKDLQTNNIDISSSKVNDSIKIDLSFKRLIATAPLVRVNKAFIEQVGANFYCILCSVCIPYSPQKYVLAKNFNFHFKSASHVFTVNKILKVENIPRISQIMKGNSKKTCRLAIDKSLKTTGKTSCSKACDKFNIEKVSPTVPSIPTKDSQSNEPRVNPASSKNKSVKVNKTNCVKVSSNRTSALKRFLNKYKLDKAKNLSDDISNKQVSQKLHPLLQKLVPDVPLLQLNKQHILRRNINFYCTLCRNDIPFSTKHHVLARYFNAHFKSKTHASSLLQTENSELEHEKQASVNHSTKGSSMTMLSQPNSTASNAERGLCNVLNEGKTVFKTTYTTLIKLKNEDIFFCNYCIKHIRTIPYKSLEFSIIEHCFKIHKREFKLQHGGIVSDVIWKNNILKANITFVEVSHKAAACSICCAAVHFSKNYSTLIFNFLMHFQDEQHKLVFRSTRQSNNLPSVGGKSKKYKPNLKAYEENQFV